MPPTAICMSLPGGKLFLYREWPEVLSDARQELASADVGMVTSYCPDGLAASALLFDAGRGLQVFYDLDTPVTLSRLRRGESVSYIGTRGLADFDLGAQLYRRSRVARTAGRTRGTAGRTALRSRRS